MGEHPEREPLDASPLIPQRAAPIERGWHLRRAQEVVYTSQSGSRTPGAEQTPERRVPSGDVDWALTRAAAPRIRLIVIDCII
jgi:hypothetical protein